MAVRDWARCGRHRPDKDWRRFLPLQTHGRPPTVHPAESPARAFGALIVVTSYNGFSPGSEALKRSPICSARWSRCADLSRLMACSNSQARVTPSAFSCKQQIFMAGETLDRHASAAIRLCRDRALSLKPAIQLPCNQVSCCPARTEIARPYCFCSMGPKSDKPHLLPCRKAFSPITLQRGDRGRPVAYTCLVRASCSVLTGWRPAQRNFRPVERATAHVGCLPAQPVAASTQQQQKADATQHC